MIKYKIDIMEELKKKGYCYSRIQKEKLVASATIEHVKKGESITLDSLGKICTMLRMQPGEVIENVITDEEKIKFF